MIYVLFDDARYHRLLPLTYTRPASTLRCGILRADERWALYMKQAASGYACPPYLHAVFQAPAQGSCLHLNGAVYPQDFWMEQAVKLTEGQALYYEDTCLAYVADTTTYQTNATDYGEKIFLTTETEPLQYRFPWDLFRLNDTWLRLDFQLLTAGRTSAPISATNTLIGTDIFLEEGASVEGCIINTRTGPVYAGRKVEMMEGCLVRGPLALCDEAVLKMGAKVYGATTLGPGCKAGGEMNNVVFQANSNKAHDGFLGNAVIGEWCNLGADTNNSNLKNTYEMVKVWSESEGRFVSTGLQFCGLIMGDHSKCGINTMFNTGTVVGVACNIFGAGFPRQFIPSFSWGGPQGIMEYQLIKAVDTATRVFARRGMDWTDADTALLQAVFDMTRSQRKS